MTITATVITLWNETTGEERDFWLRGEFTSSGARGRLDKYMDDWEIVGVVGYQQPSFAQSKHYHYTGEVI